MKKIKVLTISDSPLSFSGVGLQTRFVIEALLKSDKFEVISLAGAVKHLEYKPIKTEEWEDKWTIFPVDGFGNKDMLRSLIRNEKPDMLWFMTDPRFFDWLWDMEHEIRPLMPMVYYHVWDNYPYPQYNQPAYMSNDKIVTISKLTDDIVRNVAPAVECEYLPHAVDPAIFKPYDRETFKNLKSKIFPHDTNNTKFTFFWNGRNARRKQSGSLLWWFLDFLEKYNLEDDCRLIMHTDPKDDHGQDLERILSDRGAQQGQVQLSTGKYPLEHMALLYNIADCTLNISDAEGFGLPVLESLSCGTPVIVNMTGGLQDQITDGEAWFGIPLYPSSKAVIGSQVVPYIYEDRINKEDFHEALKKMYFMDADERKKMGMAGRDNVMKNFNFHGFKERWVSIMEKVYEKHGSWDDRKNYDNWTLVEV